MGRRRKEGEGKEDGREERERNGEDQQDGFFACYLLCSLCPRHKSRTYIGFTVNPRRRIRQHNGEIMCGAWRTKKGRPWEMVLCIYGFPSNIAALQLYSWKFSGQILTPRSDRIIGLYGCLKQFEWAWQHPTESLAVRKAASNFKSLRGLANKIKLAYTMLNLPSWENLHLTVNFFSTKYTKFSAGCPKLPIQMKVNICAMDDLPCYSKDPSSKLNDENCDQVHEPDFDSMEERSDEGGSSDNNNHPNLLQSENNYERLQDLNSGRMDRVEHQSKEGITVESDEISSPEGFNKTVHSGTGDVLLPQNDVIDLVTPQSYAVRLGKSHNTKTVSSMIDLTSSPCIIEL